MWYKFAAHNSQAVYGYGSHDQAEQFAQHLNRNRETNVYAAEPLADDDAEATRLAGGGLVDITAGGVNLDEALAEIAQA